MRSFTPILRIDPSLLLVLLGVALLPACSSPSPGQDDDDSAADDDDDTTPDDDDDSAADDDDDDDDSAQSATAPFGLYPPPGALDVSPRTVVFADASEDDLLEGGSLTLTDSTGAEISVEISQLGSARLAGRPLEALANETEHSVTVSFPGKDKPHEWSFTTGVDRPPLGQFPGAETLELDIADFLVLSPVHPDSVQAFTFSLPKLLVQLSETDGTLNIVGGGVDEWSQGLSQSVCQPSWAGTAGTWADPYFEFNSLSIPVLRATDTQAMPVNPVQYSMQVSRLSGVFDWPFGVKEVEIDGHVDLRGIGLGDICQVIAGLIPGMVCEACPGEPEALECVYMWGIGGVMNPRPDIKNLVELSTKEILLGDCYSE